MSEVTPNSNRPLQARLYSRMKSFDFPEFRQSIYREAFLSIPFVGKTIFGTALVAGGYKISHEIMSLANRLGVPLIDPPISGLVELTELTVGSITLAYIARASLCRFGVRVGRRRGHPYPPPKVLQAESHVELASKALRAYEEKLEVELPGDSEEATEKLGRVRKVRAAYRARSLGRIASKVGPISLIAPAMAYIRQLGLSDEQIMLVTLGALNAKIMGKESVYKPLVYVYNQLTGKEPQFVPERFFHRKEYAKVAFEALKDWKKAADENPRLHGRFNAQLIRRLSEKLPMYIPGFRQYGEKLLQDALDAYQQRLNPNPPSR